MKLRTILAGLALAVAVTGNVTRLPAAETALPFGSLKPMAAANARRQVEAWLKQVGKLDAAALTAIWETTDRTLLDRLTASLELGHEEIAKALATARAADQNPPQNVPAVLKNDDLPRFVRANAALAFAQALSEHRVYEEALATLKTVTPEEVADPAAYFFYKAVAEHALMQKDAAMRTIVRLLDDVQDAPDRYKMVASLMYFDLQSWPAEERNLTNITRLMDNSERRLELARGGKKTQSIQKKIVFRLDELIKELENQQSNSQCSGGSCPKGGKPGNNGGANPSAPMQDSRIATNGGQGKVTEKKLRELAENWGSLPEAERARAMMELQRDLPDRYKEVIENYFKALSKTQSNR